jgi:hypothetical protein
MIYRTKWNIRGPYAFAKDVKLPTKMMESEIIKEGNTNESE